MAQWYSNSENDPVTFRVEKGADGYLRLYATPPAGFGGIAYITWNITEFAKNSIRLNTLYRTKGKTCQQSQLEKVRM
jgi:hypothetical protein